jgi:hypothetical protein
MTSKKAVQIVEMLLEKKRVLKRDLEKPENNWGHDIAWSVVQKQLTSLSNEIGWLQILKKEIAPPYNHPKKMQDI